MNRVPFDGIEAAAHPRRTTALLVDEGEVLQPFRTKDKVFASLNPCRLILTAVLVALMLALAPILPSEKFTATFQVPESESIDQCRWYCEQTRSKDESVKAKFVKVTGGEATRCDAVNFVSYSAMKGPRGKQFKTKMVHGDEWAKMVEEAAAEKYMNETDPDRKSADMEAYQKELNLSKWSMCTFKVAVPKWKALTTVFVLIMTIVLIIQDLPPEVMLIAAATILCMLGVISRDSVFNGISNKGVTGLAVLFPISDAIQETGIIEAGVGMVLGKPKTLVSALMRMMLPVAFLSAFLSNTATVALMIPVLVTWARRLSVHPGKLLMPLSFAAQLGGVMTVLGSSTCLVAKTTMAPGGYDMGMFDMFPSGLFLLFTTGGLIAFLAKTPLLQSSGDSTDAGGSADEYKPDVYRIIVTVTQGGGIQGSTLEESGLTRIPGVQQVVFGSTDLDRASHNLETDDQLIFLSTEEGIIALRAQIGVKLKNSASLEKLGGNRRQRFLYEVSAVDDSVFATTNILRDPQTLRDEFGAAFVAGPKGPAASALGAPKVGTGSVLLFEANRNWVERKAAERWSQACGLIRKIPNSSPMRVGGPADSARGIATAVGMAVFILATSFDKKTGVELDFGGATLLIFYLVIRAISFQQLFASMKINVLLSIAGALAMGDALKLTGVVDLVAKAAIGGLSGSFSVSAMVYFMAVFLSMFINNSATVAILGPMIISIVQDNVGPDGEPTLSMAGLTWMLTFGAGSCFTTPIGYQTNMMVCPDGKYQFIDFARFGVLVQMVHMALALFIVTLLQSTMG